jgi:putative ABC transport system permease protein
MRCDTPVKEMPMRLPVAYNIRNLAVRRTTSLMTAAGIALTVAVLLASLALVNGLQSTFESTGNRLNLLVLRKGSTSELSSAMTRETFQDLLFKPGLARSPRDGWPMASLEIVTTVRLPASDNPRGMNVTVRGLLPVGIELRNLRLHEGRWFESGRREVVVGRAIARSCPGARTGGAVRFGKREWLVVGVMDGGRSALNNEIFGDLNQVSSDFNRPQQLSSVLLRVRDASTVPALIKSLNDDRRLNAFAQIEKDYYERQTAAGDPLRLLGLFVSVIMAIGSGFTAMNTMYAAIDRRTREIAILRVLGFSQRSIMLSFLLESVLLALAGGVLACVLVLPLNGISTAVGNSVTMSDVSVNFRAGPEVLLVGMAYSALLGIVGGLLPARMAARREILTALREV